MLRQQELDKTLKILGIAEESDAALARMKEVCLVMVEFIHNVSATDFAKHEMHAGQCPRSSDSTAECACGNVQIRDAGASLLRNLVGLGLEWTKK